MLPAIIWSIHCVGVVQDADEASRSFLVKGTTYMGKKADAAPFLWSVKVPKFPRWPYWPHLRLRPRREEGRWRLRHHSPVDAPRRLLLLLLSFLFLAPH
ncbi:hypothetical protein B9479_008329, partial [Cryptococcus floricola]